MTEKFSELNGWTTEGKIGQGGFGTVYEIQQIGDLGKRAALKVISIPQEEQEITRLSNDGWDNDSIAREFRKQCEIIKDKYNEVKKLGPDANVVRADEIKIVQRDKSLGWDILIRTELLYPLFKVRDIDEEKAEKVAEDICSVLALCEKHGIIHGNIKPENIFQTQNGNYLLSDFGVSRTMEEITGSIKPGMRRFMAPEAANSKNYSASADIYSLGLVLYWMLNGNRLPFEEQCTSEEAINLRCSGKALPWPAHGSDRFKAIVMKACEADPKKRFGSAGEMLAALRGNEWPVTPPIPQRRQKKGKTWQIASNAALAAAVVMAATACVVSFSAHHGSSVPQKENITAPATATAEPAEPTAVPTPAAVSIPASPASPYGQALKESIVNGVYYSNEKKTGVIGRTYDERKTGNGQNKLWYFSTHRDDIVNGYRTELYYADGLLFFANITDKKNPVVKLYYWGGDIIACTDYRISDHSLSYAGSEICDNVISEFGYVYSEGMKYAK